MRIIRIMYIYIMYIYQNKIFFNFERNWRYMSVLPELISLALIQHLFR